MILHVCLGKKSNLDQSQIDVKDAQTNIALRGVTGRAEEAP